MRMLNVSKTPVRTATPVVAVTPAGPSKVAPEETLQYQMARWKPVDQSIVERFARNGVKSLTETPICREGKTPATRFVAIDRKESAEAIASGKFNFYFGDRLALCYRRGTSVTFILFDKYNSSSPVAQIIGSATVSDIFISPVAAIPDEVFNSLALPRAAYRKAIGGSDPATFVIYNEFRKASTAITDVFPTVFPKTLMIDPVDLALWQTKLPTLVIVDPRSKEEFKAKSLPQAVNLPLILTSNPSGKELFKLKRADIEAVDAAYLAKLIEVTQANKAQGRSRPVAVVGSSVPDARTLTLLASLQQIGVQQLIWVAERSN